MVNLNSVSGCLIRQPAEIKKIPAEARMESELSERSGTGATVRRRPLLRVQGLNITSAIAA